LNPYQVPKLPELKLTILDIRAKNEKDEEFIIEMQAEEHEDFRKRSLFYSSKAYSEQIKKGEDYDKLKPVIFI
jgi:predicted transposase/invertase (TIGR01784 family)